ncbi:MAG: sulfatase, partial [Acidobacteriota bacterium]
MNIVVSRRARVGPHGVRPALFARLPVETTTSAPITKNTGRTPCGPTKIRPYFPAAAILLIVASFLTTTRCGSKKAEKVSAAGFNVVLITLDTMRADHIGAYGAASPATPNLDALARSGVRFDQAMSAVPLTLPSHATILSGLLPLHHGLRNNGAGSFPGDRDTLAAMFSRGGYRTGAFVGSFVLDHRFGLERGFEVYDDQIPRQPDTDHVMGVEAERPADAVVDRALSWLDGQDVRPFFVWIHLYDAHAPYAAPEPFRSRYSDTPYDGEVAWVDSQVGRVFADLQKRGWTNRTIVVVVGDHGESLGEHGELTHGLLLYQPTLRVPMIWSAPALAPPA